MSRIPTQREIEHHEDQGICPTCKQPLPRPKTEPKTLRDHKKMTPEESIEALKTFREAMKRNGFK